MALDEWLLFLGAGASRPTPTNLPPFVPLSEAILNAIGWETRPNSGQETDHATVERWRFTCEPYYPDIAHFDMAPEVLFGTLRSFGVSFATEVCRVLGNAEPNAVHEVAAHVLQQGGCVWTPNIDDAVENACLKVDFHPHRSGRSLRDSTSPLDPLATTKAGTYVKFHGTVEAPDTLAFTDRQLIAPLSEEDIKHLAPLARGKIVVLYGYAGADADLADLVDRLLEDAREIHWFEPSKWSHDLILQAFPAFKDRIRFVPDWEDEESEHNSVRHMAQTFLELARSAHYAADPQLTDDLIEGRGSLRELDIQLKTPSGATQARLVERFGANDPGDDKVAWAKAWKYDLLHLRVRAFPQHLRHRVSYSLYHSGAVASLVRWLASKPDVLRRVQPGRLRNYFITRACALLLRDHNWSRLRDFVTWAIGVRSGGDGEPVPSDLYYEAQAFRYSFLPAQARQSADRAIHGLENLADPERLAGALYEAGDAALYQADFNAALGYAFQLRYRRGRYAIPRWQAWGAWLETVADAHLGMIDETLDQTIAAMTDRFDYEREPLNRADARTAELLVARVRLARTGSLGLSSLDHPTDSARTGRYLDDLDLLRADIAIALGDQGDARRRLQRVLDKPATPVSRLWARVGLAELERLRSPTAGADEFWVVAEEAHQSKAAWLEGQALLGVQLCDDVRAEDGWQRLASIWPSSGGVTLEAVRATPADPHRVLWMVTL